MGITSPLVKGKRKKEKNYHKNVDVRKSKLEKKENSKKKLKKGKKATKNKTKNKNLFMINSKDVVGLLPHTFL